MTFFQELVRNTAVRSAPQYRHAFAACLTDDPAGIRPDACSASVSHEAVSSDGCEGNRRRAADIEAALQYRQRSC